MELPRHSNADGVVNSPGARDKRAHSPRSTWLPRFLVLTAILLAIGAILHFVRPARPPPAEESLLLRSTGAPRAPDVDSLAKHVDQSGGGATAAAIAAARSAGVHVMPAAPRLDGPDSAETTPEPVAWESAETTPEPVAWESADAAHLARHDAEGLEKRLARARAEGGLAGRALLGECIDVEVDGDTTHPSGAQSGSQFDVVDCQMLCMHDDACEGTVFAAERCHFLKNIRGLKAAAAGSGSLFEHKFADLLACPPSADVHHAGTDVQKLLLVEKVLGEAFPRAKSWLHGDIAELYRAHHGNLPAIWRSLHKHDGEKDAIKQDAAVVAAHAQAEAAAAARGRELSRECQNVAVDGDMLTGQAAELEGGADGKGLPFEDCETLCAHSRVCEAITHSLDAHNRCTLWTNVRGLDAGDQRHFKSKRDLECPPDHEAHPTDFGSAASEDEKRSLLLLTLQRLFAEHTWNMRETNELYDKFGGELLAIWRHLGVENFATTITRAHFAQHDNNELR
jgi:hypothetical protein